MGILLIEYPSYTMTIFKRKEIYAEIDSLSSVAYWEVAHSYAQTMSK